MSDEFYVGYLPVGTRQRRFLVGIISTFGVVLIVLAVLLTAIQNDPGDGQWDLNEPVTLVGRISTDPYAILTVPSGDDSPDRHVLLVTMGKIGGEHFAAPVDGQWMRVTGYPVERDGRTLLTLEHAPVESASQDDSRAINLSPPDSLGTHSLVGEIIDPKCYFGAMKPGEGKVHKSCATLCIRGGMPPMFMTRNENNERFYYLLTDPNGKGLRGELLEALLPFVADPVRVEGEIHRWGDLYVFRIDPAAVTRQ